MKKGLLTILFLVCLAFFSVACLPSENGKQLLQSQESVSFEDYGQGREDRSNQIKEDISCNERVLNDKLWYGTVQIESIVVPYNEVKLSSFEELGYELQLEELEAGNLQSKQYDEIVESNRISIVKDGLEVVVYLQENSMDSSYRDAVIKYVEHIYRYDNFDIPIWVCGGIQFGDNIDEIPEYTDVSVGWEERSTNEKTLNFLINLDGEARGFSAAEPFGNYFNWAEEERFPVWGPPKITLHADNNNLINAYQFEHGLYAAQTQEKIEYQLETYQLDNGKVINCPTIDGEFVSYRDRYGISAGDKYDSQASYITNACFYENGNSYAYVTLTLLHDNQVFGRSDSLLVYKGEEYSVYQIDFNHNRSRDNENLAYLFCLIRDDDVNQETPINFDLVIWDNTGKMIPEFREEDSYTLFSENINLQTDYYESSFACQLAIDIFDHIAQYTIE